MHAKWCPGCRAARTARGMPCQQCWRQIPGSVRRAYVNAHRARVQQPVRFQEETINVLQWCRNHRFG